VTAVAALVTTGLLSASAAANTAAADEQRAAAQFRCGFYESGGSAYYGHCDAPPRTDIVIHVTGEFPNLTEYDMCVKPGVTYLGPATLISYAVYTGRLCSAG
jgi:hypothetical protein